MKHSFLLETSDLLKEVNKLDRAENTINQFMKHLSMIGQKEISVDEDELDMFLKETSGMILDASMHLHKYLFDTEKILMNEFYGDEWVKVCQLRSSIEYLKNMYYDYIDPDWNLFLDCEDLDDMLEQKGDYEGGGVEHIPDGVPVSHWWWWYPEEPPENR